MRARTAIALLALSLGGCVVDLEANPAYGCASDEDCAQEERCDRGFCVAREDGCGAEVACNGVDDDCDGDTDEIDDPTCETGRPGACGVGTLGCLGGLPTCEPPMPEAETCNGVDDDCDAQTDEVPAAECYPVGEDGCEDADGDGELECTGVCDAGVRLCVEGELTECEGAVIPTEEACGDALARDEDCDGLIDEGCTCTDDQACYGGPDDTLGVGACRAGTQTCDGGMLSPSCDDQVVPGAESCSNPGVDDDCDGVRDDVPRLHEPCEASGVMGACRSGSLECPMGGGGLECAPAEPRTELCDGLDDDCDGAVDEDFDTSSDPMHCGACGNACGSGQECCGGACVDVRSDPASCGSCGNACAPGQMCCGGTCGDPASCGTCSPACTGSDSCCGGACVDTSADESHCGACGNACGAGEVCCGGSCVTSDETHCGDACATCGSGSELCCSGSCVTIGNANCNACGVTCSTGECCSSGCVDLGADAANCGACGNACPMGQACSEGHCCPSGQTWCDAAGSCRDLSSDDAHCGSCGNACGSASACCGGSCRLLTLGCS